jgi:hypothetical protein
MFLIPVAKYIATFIFHTGRITQYRAAVKIAFGGT